MPTPRKNQIDLSETSYYHCISRCVRKAYLCGLDKATGKDFNHRKAWLVGKMKDLTVFFAIDICAYAVMSNHYHIVLRVDQEKALAWSDSEVVERWAKLFRLSKATNLVKETLSAKDLSFHQKDIDTWRAQLYNISWFMRVLNEGIARQANKEDDCRGRFWESRFRSQALLDEAAILTCMTYVDLNPIRAKMAKTPEASDFTSIQERIRAAQKRKQPKELAPLTTQNQKSNPLPVALDTYLDLVHASGQVMRKDKRGCIPEQYDYTLTSLGINPSCWMDAVRSFETQFEGFVGAPKRMEQLKETKGKQRVRGIAASVRLFLRKAA